MNGKQAETRKQDSRVWTASKTWWMQAIGLFWFECIRWGCTKHIEGLHKTMCKHKNLHEDMKIVYACIKVLCKRWIGRPGVSDRNNQPFCTKGCIKGLCTPKNRDKQSSYVKRSPVTSSFDIMPRKARKLWPISSWSWSQKWNISGQNGLKIWLIICPTQYSKCQGGSTLRSTFVPWPPWHSIEYAYNGALLHPGVHMDTHHICVSTL